MNRAIRKSQQLPLDATEGLLTLLSLPWFEARGARECFTTHQIILRERLYFMESEF